MVKRAKGRRKSGAMWLIVVIVAFISALLWAKTSDLSDQYNAKEQQLAGIKNEIAVAEDKTEEIRDEIRYRETDDYIEDQAREALGLRYPDEVILVPENTQD